jgi:predicted nucleic acid-binding protein
VLYLDSSAIVKLVVSEPESAALVQEVASDPDVVSSQIALTEVVRAVGRAKGPIRRAERIVRSVALVPIDHPILIEAATMRPWTLRSLDAIHLASALSLRPDVDAFIAYDARLLEAAEGAGLVVRSPGAA